MWKAYFIKDKTKGVLQKSNTPKKTHQIVQVASLRQFYLDQVQRVRENSSQPGGTPTKIFYFHY